MKNKLKDNINIRIKLERDLFINISNDEYNLLISNSNKKLNLKY